MEFRPHRNYTVRWKSTGALRKSPTPFRITWPLLLLWIAILMTRCPTFRIVSRMKYAWNFG